MTTIKSSLARITTALTLGTVLFAATSISTKAAEPEFSADKKQEIRKIVRDYLLKNPEVIMEAIQVLRRRQAEARKKAAQAALSQYRNELLTADSGMVGGNPNGNVTVVEFMDYRCGYCKAAKVTLDKIVKADGNIRVVYKEFPILGPVSMIASRAALAARKQGKYIPFHNALMAHQARLTPGAIMKIAKKTGLDIEQLRKDMGDADISARINRNHQIAKNLGINGTPAFIVGNELIPGALQEADFKAKITAARAFCKKTQKAVC